MRVNPTYERVISIHSRFQGITNVLGLIGAVFIGVILIIIGIIVSFGMKSFVPIIVLGLLGTLFILFARLISKASKHQLKGEYYVLGKGWQKPNH